MTWDFSHLNKRIVLFSKIFCIAASALSYYEQQNQS